MWGRMFTWLLLEAQSLFKTSLVFSLHVSRTSLSPLLWIWYVLQKAFRLAVKSGSLNVVTCWRGLKDFFSWTSSLHRRENWGLKGAGNLPTIRGGAAGECGWEPSERDPSLPRRDTSSEDWNVICEPCWEETFSLMPLCSSDKGSIDLQAWNE